MLNKIFVTSIKLGLLSLISLFILISCEEAEIANPADPNYVLDPPTLLSADAVTDTEIEIVWKNNEEHSKEFVISRESGSGSYSVIGTVVKDLLAFTDTACVLGTEYSYVVQSKVSSNYSVNSNILKKTITFPAPSNLTVIPISDESVLLAWTDNTGYEDGFKIERDAGSGFTEIGQVTSNVTNFIDTGLTYGQSYNYRIAAYTSANTSSWATITAATEFPAPSELTASSVSDSEIQLTWTDNTGYETGFKIERDGGSGFTEIATVSADANVYTDSGLTFGQSYDYRIAAISANNISDYTATATASATAPLVDWDGNTYGTVRIGNQVWMTENLKVTHYRDGTPITPVTDPGEWTALTTEAYCIYNNNTSNELDTYGALFNWYAVNGDTDGDGVKDEEIAPEGWHVPTDDEWTTLTNHLGGAGVAGEKLKETGTNHWNSPNTGATNESGFTALPGGYRTNNGNYYVLGTYGYFWSATESSSSTAWYRILNYGDSDVGRVSQLKRFGFSVRCVRD